MARIYTRTGDTGSTCLAGGRRVSKIHPRVEAYGTVDELNACIALAMVELEKAGDEVSRRIRDFLLESQSRLFELGAELACLPEDLRADMPMIREAAVARVEGAIDELEAKLPELRVFVLPGGGRAGAQLHFVRTVCRRAEREILRLHEESPVRGEALRYVNRLSDYLFVAARAAAVAAGEDETVWTAP
ncbi:MAG: cob(I)yrinic acid a,c-diamide adenosyltransferase [Myxococcota bacterium]